MELMKWLSILLFAIGCTSLQAQTMCPMCRKPIVPSRSVYAVFTVGSQDYRLTFRCIACALHAAERWHPNRALLRTRCVATNRWVTLKWADGRWLAEPESARLLLAPEVGGECLNRHLVFSNPSAARRFLARHPALKTFPLLPATQLPKVDHMAGAGKE